jgi:1-acyl-sn-glycerol-3-phosphate acyltransferase
MHNIFIEKPYQFVPAMKAAWPQRIYRWFGLHRITLRRREGVWDYEVRHADRLGASISEGHAVLLTPNHPRMADPAVMHELGIAAKCPLYFMASWHLFNQGAAIRFVVRMMGAFSVNREGMDRTAIDNAIDILKNAHRPLVIFPEGTTSRTNDRLMSLMEGPSFIARTAAKRRAKDELGSGKVVVHPVAIKYVFTGDVEAAVKPVLADIEKRLSWTPQTDMPLVDRIVKVGDALLKIKELQFGCEVPEGTFLRQRQTNMVNHLLNPLEEEWLGGPQDGGIQIRIKNLRVKIFPDMIGDKMELSERKRRWAQLERTYLAQQIDCYPDQYLTEHPSVDRILETVEKFEEDFTEKCRIHGHLKAIIEVGEPIEVSTKREKGVEADPLMSEIRIRLEGMLSGLQPESKMYDEPA